MYLAALDPMSLVRALPGNVAQGIIWGIMALGVYITFRILDFADLTVDGSLATGGADCGSGPGSPCWDDASAASFRQGRSRSAGA